MTSRGGARRGGGSPSRPGRPRLLDPREDAARILVAALSGRRRSTDLLDRALRAYPPDREPDARLLHELVMGVLRRRLALAAVVGGLVRGGLGRVSPLVREVLLVLAYQALFLERVPAHARVSSAVEAARRCQGEGAARLVNAVGRALEARLRDGGDPVAGMDPRIRWSLPEPAWNRMRATMGRDPTEEEAARLAEPASSTFRVHRARGGRGEVLARLREAGVVATPTRFATEGVAVTGRGVLRPGSRAPDGGPWTPGWMLPQDEASMLAVQVLDPRPGEWVVDLCAGVGVKTTDILARAPGGTVVAVDRDARRLARAGRLCRRMGVGEPVFLAADARHLPADLAGRADAVLVDAPCTGIGTLRRRPEVRYLRREEDFARAAEVQRDLLAAAVGLLRPGGRAVYVVCSFAPEEGPEVVAAVLAARDDLRLEPIALPSPLRRPDGTAMTWPWRDGMDGFYLAVLRRV